MPKIQPVSPEMIKTFIKSHDWHYMIDEDGDFRITFAFDAERGAKATVWFILAGSQKEIYTVMFQADRQIPKADWARAVMLCNKWNRERRWPKAYLNIKDNETADEAAIILESQIDFEHGVHQELFDQFTGHSLGGSEEFWELAHGEHGF